TLDRIVNVIVIPVTAYTYCVHSPSDSLAPLLGLTNPTAGSGQTAPGRKDCDDDDSSTEAGLCPKGQTAPGRKDCDARNGLNKSQDKCI
ncbi:hypothetical protein RRG08_045420, partial [Elysia crispata]